MFVYFSNYKTKEINIFLTSETTTKTDYMKAKIQTKSNYKNLNGQWLEVAEIVCNRITCYYFCKDFWRLITIDFIASEILEYAD